MGRRAQIWGIDLMIALSLFSIGLIFFYFFALNYTNESEENLGNLFFTGESIMNILLSEGDLGGGQIRLLNYGKINNTFLEDFYNTNYEITKIKFGTSYDYFFTLSENIEIEGETISGIGKPGVNSIEDVESENLININRLVIYNNKIVSANLYLWE